MRPAVHALQSAFMEDLDNIADEHVAYHLSAPKRSGQSREGRRLNATSRFEQGRTGPQHEHSP